MKSIAASFLRGLLWVLVHLIYRVRVEGRSNVPRNGGALFVCNHVSFVDALLVQAATDRPLRCILLDRKSTRLNSSH